MPYEQNASNASNASLRIKVELRNAFNQNGTRANGFRSNVIGSNAISLSKVGVKNCHRK
jgi:hypothetical protein